MTPLIQLDFNDKRQRKLKISKIRIMFRHHSILGQTNVPNYLLDKFDVVVESAKFGERKPQLPIYEEVLKKLGLPGEETVFLDDIGSNLKAANKLGIQTIKVKGGHPQNAIHELQNLLDQKLVDWPKGSTPIRKGMELDIGKLKIYFEKELGITGDAMDLRQFDHGQSNPTYYVRYVPRFHPFGTPN